MAHLVLKLLGEFAARASDGGPVAIGAKKNRALLAILALAPRGSMARERLADLLWSDHGAEQARSSLRQALVALRKDLAVVEPITLVADDETVRLDPALLDVDVLQLQQLASTGSASDLGEAAALCVGELLDGLQVNDPNFEEWLGNERRKWHGVCVSVLDQHCSTLTGQSKLNAANALVALDPLREASHRHLIQAYADAGERTQALKQYEACRAVLARDLNVEPGEDIEGLRRSLLNAGKPPNIAPATDRPVAIAGHVSIAVFPFSNLSGDPEQTYFSDGFSEDIITELSRFRSLFVIARNTSFHYCDRSADFRSVAQDLGVQYAVEGSVRRTAGDRVRITAKLIDAVRGSQLWGERYDRDLDQLFQVQDEVVSTIAATVFGQLEDAEIRDAKRKPPENMAAYDKLLHGIEHLRGYGPDDNRQARELFESAVALDPDYALAQAYLGLSLLVENRYSTAPSEIKARALECTRKAVRLQPSESRCQQFLALAYRFTDEYDLAIQHYERAVALNPNDANAIASLGSALAVVGRAEEGLHMIRQAMRLNPLHPDWYWGSLVIAFYNMRRYQDALEANWKLGAGKSAWQVARGAACLAQLGRLEEAHKQVAEVLRLNPDFSIAKELPSYKNPVDIEHLVEGLRKAGLPS